jgi:hypothetical protein
LVPNLGGSATGDPLSHHDTFNPPYCFGKAEGYGVRTLREPFVVSPVQMDGMAACPAAGLHVPPPVTDHDTARQVESEVLGRGNQQAGCRLATPTAVGVVVGAHIEAVDHDLLAQLPVNGIDDLD